MFYCKLKSTTSCEIWAARCHGTFGTLRVKFMWLICGILRLARRSAIIFEKCQRRAEQRRWEINLLCSPAPAPLCPLSPPAVELERTFAKFKILQSLRRPKGHRKGLYCASSHLRHYAKRELIHSNLT